MNFPFATTITRLPITRPCTAARLDEPRRETRCKRSGRRSQRRRETRRESVYQKVNAFQVISLNSKYHTSSLCRVVWLSFSRARADRRSIRRLSHTRSLLLSRRRVIKSNERHLFARHTSTGRRARMDRTRLPSHAGACVRTALSLSRVPSSFVVPRITLLKQV